MVNAEPPLVLPFRGERFAERELSARLAPPYDVISPDERRALAARNPHNIVRLILPEAGVGKDQYLLAATLLTEWRRAGVLVRDPAPAVYVLEQAFPLPGGGMRTRVGLFGAVAAEPYDAGRVRPHERTHAGPKADRLALLRATATALESIFLLAPDAGGELTRALSGVTRGAPSAEGTLGDVRHRLWIVTGAPADALAASAGRAPLYIADGHHRYETAVAYAKENPAADRVLSLIVPATDPGLTVLATHRVVYGIGFDLSPLLGQWQQWFEVTATPPLADPVGHLAAAGAHGTACVVALPDGRDLTLVLRDDAPLGEISVLGKSPAARSLDVAIVEALVVKPILGAGTSTPTLTYTPDAAKALDAARRGRAAAAVLLNPTRVAQVIAVADAGDVMPQKSTYFVPKVPAGLVLRPV